MNHYLTRGQGRLTFECNVEGLICWSIIRPSAFRSIVNSVTMWAYPAVSGFCFPLTMSYAFASKSQCGAWSEPV